MPDEPLNLGHTTYGAAGSVAVLPEGFTRAEGVASNVGVQQARVLRFRLRCTGGQVVHVVAIAGERPSFRPEPRERIRDLRLNDLVRLTTSGVVARVIGVG